MFVGMFYFKKGEEKKNHLLFFCREDHARDEGLVSWEEVGMTEDT